MTMLAALLGALAGLGLLVAGVALRGADPASFRPRRRTARPGLSERSERVEQLTLRLALGAGAAVVVGAVTRWPVAALLLGAAGFMAPNLLGGRSVRQAKVAEVEAIAAWAEMLRDTMAGAGGLEQSIIACAPIAPPPIRAPVVRLAASLERERLAVALRVFADELDDPTGDLVVAALLLAADKSPRRVGALLGMLASSARAEVNMRMRVETGRARTRTSVKVISISTMVFSTGLLLLNRAYLAPYDSAVGQAVLGLVGTCFAGAFVWLERSSRIASNDRLLTAVGDGR